MVSEEPIEGRCNAGAGEDNWGYCESWPVTDDDGEPVNGRCRMHGGKDSGAPEDNQNAVGNDGGAPENNGNAETHGLTADAEKWFERHRDDVEDDVKQMVDDWMELAPFGWEVSGNVRMLTNAAINECQIEQGDRYIAREGVITTEQIPTESGGVINKDESNPAFLFKSRLQKDTVRILNKLGVLNSPEQQQADSMRSIADILSED